MRIFWCLIFLSWVLTSCSPKTVLPKDSDYTAIDYGSKTYPEWRFVSMPDFLNVDTDFPEPDWESSLSFILESVRNENPEFLSVAGDLVMGHWFHPSWNYEDSIAKYSDHYYSAWKNRMQAMNLKYYTSIGDHEIGDDPWHGEEKKNAVKLFKKAFAQHLDMPKNGPSEYEGTAFYWVENNALFISVDVFEMAKSEKGFIRPGVTGSQLQWVDEILTRYNSIPHKFVIGHVPILGPVRKQSSSGMMMVNGASSDFWKLLMKHRIDAYLCGEVHAITCTQKDGILQIAHGGLIGYNRQTNYLVVNIIDNNTVSYELKEISIQNSGPRLWQTGTNRPHAKVNISSAERSKGFSSVGTLTVTKADRSKSILNKMGYFADEIPNYKRANSPNKRKKRQRVKN